MSGAEVCWAEVREFWELREWFIEMVRNRFRLDAFDADDLFSSVLVRVVAVAEGGKRVGDLKKFAYVYSRFEWLEWSHARKHPASGPRRMNEARSVAFELELIKDVRAVDLVAEPWAAELVLIVFDEARSLGPVQRAVFEVVMRIAAEGTFERGTKRTGSLYTRVARDASEMLGRDVSSVGAGRALVNVRDRMLRAVARFVLLFEVE